MKKFSKTKIGMMFIVGAPLILTAIIPASAVAAGAQGVLEAGKHPDIIFPVAPDYSQPFKRKMQAGGMELCRFQQALYSDPGTGLTLNTGSGTIMEDCHPLIGTQSTAPVCTWVDTEIGVPVHSCQAPPREVVNPDAPFEACKYVRLTEASASATKEIRELSHIVSACEMVNRPSNGLEQLTQLFRTQSYIRSAVMGHEAPELPASSQTTEVKSVLDLAIEAANRTNALLNLGQRDFQEKKRCFAENERIIKEATTNPDHPKHAAITKVEGDHINSPETTAIIADMLGERCAAVVTAEIQNYNKHLKDLRMQMLLARTRAGQVGVEHFWRGNNNPANENLINLDFETPKDVLLPSNGIARDRGDVRFSPASKEEKDAAIKVMQSWAEEIDREFNQKYAAELKNPKVKTRSGYEPGMANRFVVKSYATSEGMGQGNAESEDLQHKWAVFYDEQIRERREKARKAVEAAIVQTPIFQAHVNSNPSLENWSNGFKELEERNLKSQDMIWESMKKARLAQEKYRNALAIHRAGNGPKPKEPSLEDVAELVTAKGALSAMVEDDPRLCAAATMYWDTVRQKQNVDAVIETGVLIGGTVAACALGGPGVCAVVGIGAGGAAGVAGYVSSSNQADLGHGLLTVCQKHEDKCRTPGDMEQYLNDRFSSSLALYTMPFIGLPKDIAVATATMGAMGVGIFQASARVGKNIAQGNLALFTRDGMNYEALALLRRNPLLYFKTSNADLRVAGDIARTKIYKAAFGVRSPTMSQTEWADRLLAAGYQDKDGVMFIADPLKKIPGVDPKEVARMYLRDMEVFSEAIGFAASRQDGTLLSVAKFEELIKLLQNKETGIPLSNPEHLKEILHTATMMLAEGKTPQQALATLKNFMDMARTSGNVDHLAGLSQVYQRQLENLQQRFTQIKKKTWSEASPSEKAQWLERWDRNPALREEARLQVITDELGQQYANELRAAGKSEAEISAAVAAKRDEHALQAKDMNCCAGGTSCKVPPT